MFYCSCDHSFRGMSVNLLRNVRLRRPITWRKMFLFCDESHNLTTNRACSIANLRKRNFWRFKRSGPAYLADSLQWVTDDQSRRRLRSSSSSSLIVPVTRRATLGDRAFPVVAARAWNGLPDYVTSASTYLFSRTFWHWQHASHWLCNVVLKRCCACTTLILSYDDADDADADADADDDDDDDDDERSLITFWTASALL